MTARAQPVLLAQRDAARDRQAAGPDRLAPTRHAGRVLHVTLRQRADRGRAEAQQHRRIVRGVALEVAPQLTGPCGNAQRVVGTGEMIETDRVVAGVSDHLLGRLALGIARGRVRQRLDRQQRLLLLHPRHVSIAEHRNTVRLDRQRAAHGGRNAVHGLVRQAVDQVEIDRTDANAAQPRRASGRGLERLDAPDGTLHFGVEILHAEAGPRGADPRQAGQRRVIQCARIDLYRDLGIRLQMKPFAATGW